MAAHRVISCAATVVELAAYACSSRLGALPSGDMTHASGARTAGAPIQEGGSARALRALRPRMERELASLPVSTLWGLAHVMMARGWPPEATGQLAGGLRAPTSFSPFPRYFYNDADPDDARLIVDMRSGETHYAQLALAMVATQHSRAQLTLQTGSILVADVVRGEMLRPDYGRIVKGVEAWRNDAQASRDRTHQLRMAKSMSLSWFAEAVAWYFCDLHIPWRTPWTDENGTTVDLAAILRAERRLRAELVAANFDHSTSEAAAHTAGMLLRVGSLAAEAEGSSSWATEAFEDGLKAMSEGLEQLAGQASLDDEQLNAATHFLELAHCSALWFSTPKDRTSEIARLAQEVERLVAVALAARPQLTLVVMSHALHAMRLADDTSGNSPSARRKCVSV